MEPDAETKAKIDEYFLPDKYSKHEVGRLATDIAAKNVSEEYIVEQARVKLRACTDWESCHKVLTLLHYFLNKTPTKGLQNIKDATGLQSAVKMKFAELGESKKDTEKAALREILDAIGLEPGDLTKVDKPATPPADDLFDYTDEAVEEAEPPAPAEAPPEAKEISAEGPPAPPPAPEPPTAPPASGPADTAPTPKGLGTISGFIVGVRGKKYTQPIRPASAFLLLHIVNKEGGVELYYPALKKHLPRLMRTAGIEGSESLQARYPEIYIKTVSFIQNFGPIRIRRPEELVYEEELQGAFERFALARFEFRDIPLDSWGYVAAAFVEDKLYMHTAPMGSNGFGEEGAIAGEDVLSIDDNDLDNVVIPVKDNWIHNVKPAEKALSAGALKVNETDEGMDDHDHVKSLKGGEI
jgi:hypothetical protein